MTEKLSIDEARIVITVSDDDFNRLQKQAVHQRKNSLEQHCKDLVLQSLVEKIGAPIIDTPGVVNGEASKKITGPSWANRVSTADE